MTEFQEMTAIVTGGATGIGEATAQTLAKLGASVCIIDINDQGAEAVVSGINSSGGVAVKQIVDLTSWDATNAAVNSFAESNGRLDVVVHCAGGFPSYVSLLDCPVESWDLVVNSNLRSMFYLLKAAAPLMVQRGYGRFVSLTSMAARSGVNPNPPHYTAAKGGMLALTRQAARDLGPHGITVNNVAPANVQTPRTKAIRSADRIAHIQKTTPVGRLSEPQEIADAIVFLASPRASYITGVTLDVNGGATMIQAGVCTTQEISSPFQIHNVTKRLGPHRNWNGNLSTGWPNREYRCAGLNNASSLRGDTILWATVVLGQSDTVKLEWRAIFTEFHDRFVFATDFGSGRPPLPGFLRERVANFERIVRDLPRKVRHAFAYENAWRLLTGKLWD